MNWNNTYLQSLITQFSKFAGVGSICACFSLGTNFILLKYFQSPLIVTYCLVQLFSILLSYTLNSCFTFKTSFSFQKLVFYYLVYFSSMLLGVGLLYFYQYLIDLDNWCYPFLVIPITMVWNFCFVSRLLGPSEKSKQLA